MIYVLLMFHLVGYLTVMMRMMIAIQTIMTVQGYVTALHRSMLIVRMLMLMNLETRKLKLDIVMP